MIQFEGTNYCVFESALYQTTSTVLKSEKAIIVIDPNWLPHEIKQIQHYIQKIKGDRKLILLFTHSDYDHIIGYKAFEADHVIASHLFSLAKKDQILQEIIDFDDRFYIKRSYPIVFPKVDASIEKDKQGIDLGDIRLEFYLAPGHTKDGLITLVEDYNLLIVGDYLSAIEFPFIYDSFYAYLKTIHKIELLCEKFNIEQMIVGHGVMAKNKEEINRRIQQDLSYLYTIKEVVENGATFDINEYGKKYPFPNNIIPFHKDNLNLIRKELKQ